MNHYFEITIDNVDDNSKDIFRFEDAVKAEAFQKNRFGIAYPCFCYDTKHHALLERKQGEIPYDRYLHVA